MEENTVSNRCIRVRGHVIGVAFRMVLGLALALFAGGTASAALSCERCAVGTVPLPRNSVYGSTNFLSAYVSRDFRAGQGGCFYANGTGVTRKLVSSKPLRFVVSFIPVIDVSIVTQTGTGSVNVSANMSSLGPSGGISGGGAFSVATSRGGFITLNTSSFSAVTNGTTRMATISSRFCPLIPTTRVWMQGMTSFDSFGAENIATMTQAI
jgi:hypothetical protein